jgi:DNA replication licensing factor MCM3
MINKLVGVQGIVTRVSIVRQKLLRSVHYCEKTNVGLVREYNNEHDLIREK